LFFVTRCYTNAILRNTRWNVKEQNYLSQEIAKSISRYLYCVSLDMLLGVSVTHINNTSTCYVNSFGNFTRWIMMSCVMCVCRK